MPSKSSSQQPADTEMGWNKESWKLPYSINDSDLTFDGKPLNMLYEENRYYAEHVIESRVKYSNHGDKSHNSSRGRSRQSQK